MIRYVMSRTLHALSPYDGRYEELGQELAPYFSEGGLIQLRIIIEIRYLLYLSKEKIVRTFTAKEQELLNSYIRLEDASLLRIKTFEKTINHDVQAVVLFLREELNKTSLSDIVEFIHFGLTSEDINNLSWRLALVKARDAVFIPSINNLIHQLTDVAEQYKATPMLARTHGQPAIPTTFGKEMINVAVRLNCQLQKLSVFVFQGKLNGAVGNYTAQLYVFPTVNWMTFSERFIQSFGFTVTHFTTQVNPNDDIVEYLQIIERINTIIHGFAEDMWRYISDDLIIQKPSGVGSSTMPQKINPIHFEHSEGVTEIANGLIQVLTTRLMQSRLQRDLSDTPLFRFLGEVHAGSLDAIRRITQTFTHIYPNSTAMHDVLWNNWAILSEPLQLVLRKAYIKDAYAEIKKRTQGKRFTEDIWERMISEIISDYNISDKKVCKSLRSLNPDTYIGEAIRLTEIGLRLLRKKATH